jgi:hypothetical protein
MEAIFGKAVIRFGPSSASTTTSRSSRGPERDRDASLTRNLRVTRLRSDLAEPLKDFYSLSHLPGRDCSSGMRVES